MQAEPGYVAAPAGDGAGVLVLHAWWGLSDGIRRFCDGLVEEGASLALRRTAAFLRSQLQKEGVAPLTGW